MIFYFLRRKSEMAKLWVAISIIALLCSSLLLSVMCGVGYDYFSKSLLIYHPDADLEILFGVGIGIGIASFVGIWFFLLIPKFLFHYFATFPIFIFTTVVFAYFTSDHSLKLYIAAWDSKWQDSLTTQSLQELQGCCGWENLTDRALTPCPFFIGTSCKTLIQAYLSPRFSELFYSMVIILLIFIISVVPLIVFIRKTPEPDLISQLDVL